MLFWESGGGDAFIRRCICVRNRPEVFATVCKCPHFFASEYREGIKFISCGRHGRNIFISFLQNESYFSW